ncbi:Slam-dependent surface lipoprotein [Pseudomonas jinjuensis]|uniref:Transferrin binding protein-like solute binding protein n=1 Tax=Pseudomonas jinjuensis TaxID=198616 RepID=A0A1H0BYF2_9PSED|nr:Slam-dependent surface lipoprotein [Pseudomonas jinjuensis]SDN50718.1 Transferrin binding protein-like solute binding protein [Pseudomonas jinjuensis]
MGFMDIGRLTAVGLAICLAMGCSSGGGGNHFRAQSDKPSGDESGDNSGGVVVPASNATAGTASGQTYVTPTGATYTLVNVTGTSMSAGNDGTLTYGSNGSNGYARYGAWYSKAHTTTEYFYTGDNPTQANQVPSSGTATYAGRAVRANTTDGVSASSGSTPVSFNVDFAAKTINGVTEERAGFSSVSMKGNINGGGFSGSATSGTAKGTFAGHFYGADAAELAGMATFAADAKQNMAFGAVKQ